MGILVTTANDSGMVCIDAEMVDFVIVDKCSDGLYKIKVYMRNDPNNPIYITRTIDETNSFVDKLTKAKARI